MDTFKMNQQQLQQIYAAQQQAIEANKAPLMAFGALQILFFIALLIGGITAIHCAHKGPKEGRTAWTIVILAVPLLGWISYWSIADRPIKDDGVFTGIR